MGPVAAASWRAAALGWDGRETVLVMVLARYFEYGAGR